MRTLGIVATLVMLSGCASVANQPERQQVNMANPASVYCLEVGGTSTIKETPTGQTGVCTLADGSQIDEWELYRRDHK